MAESKNQGRDGSPQPSTVISTAELLSSDSGRHDWALTALLCSAFCMGFSMPLGRLGMLAATIALLVDIARGRRRWQMPATAWVWLLLLLLAGVVTWYGLNPAKGVKRLTKLLWFIGIPVAASIIDSREQMWRVLRALLLGTAALAVRVLIRNPISAGAIVNRFAKTPSAKQFTFAQELIFQGRLDDGQRLMVGLVGAVALVLGGAALQRCGARRLLVKVSSAPPEPEEKQSCLAPVTSWIALIPVWPLLITVLAVAEVVALKRGSWLSALTVLTLLLARGRRLKWVVLALLLLAGVAATVTPIRQRILHVGTELQVSSGGRLAMWSRVAPELLRQYPRGIGFRAMTSELMRSIEPRVEPDRDHLHSNFVELAVSLGWAGLALYLLWMGLLCRDALLSDATPQPIFWMLLALFLNGFVEYNFADGEIVIITGLLGGMAAAGKRLNLSRRR